MILFNIIKIIIRQWLIINYKLLYNCYLLLLSSVSSPSPPPPPFFLSISVPTNELPHASFHFIIPFFSSISHLPLLYSYRTFLFLHLHRSFSINLIDSDHPFSPFIFSLSFHFSFHPFRTPFFFGPILSSSLSNDDCAKLIDVDVPMPILSVCTLFLRCYVSNRCKKQVTYTFLLKCYRKYVLKSSLCRKLATRGNRCDDYYFTF